MGYDFIPHKIFYKYKIFYKIVINIPMIFYIFFFASISYKNMSSE